MKSIPDLSEKPLQNPELILYTNGSSFIGKGKRYFGHAVVLDFETLEAKALPEGW